ncbi:MAG: FAD-dependent oxidoreductase [Gemmatimonadales bacterium]|nr:FAD-dependent oxidoreductase [Gemmatimonadales bacterium]
MPPPSNHLPHVVILGAGPAGVGAAYRLRRQDRATVTVLEQNPVVGGNAGSFEVSGQRLDYGSHRLHPACDSEILGDIRRLLGDDLLDRPRHGRIHLRGKWIHFPLTPIDLLLRLDPRFSLGTARDAMRNLIGRSKTSEDTFAGVLLANLGPTICHDFYFPYAEKIWGHDPSELSAIQARRRVSAGSFGKLVRKVLASVPGFKPPGSGRFYYPRRGYGQISEAYAEAARDLGASFRLGHRVTGLTAPSDAGAPWVVQAGQDGQHQTIHADYLWSTIPIPALARAMHPPAPPAVQQAAAALRFRGMILIYLELPVHRFSEFDAHYFPSSATRMTRMSEPKNYALLEEPRGRTTLCAELPCEVSDEWWDMDDATLGDVIAADLDQVGIPLPARPLRVHVKRLRQAYPIYLSGYEGPFRALDEWVSTLPRALSYGRQGLFAHDNTHHALAMAYAAADCLQPTGFDQSKWDHHREIFATHVVED